jgi:hypothetical protein
MSYPSLYDAPPSNQQQFRVMHSQLLAAMAAAGGMRKVDTLSHLRHDADYYMRALTGSVFTYNDVVQWRRSDHANWQYGIVKGYDPAQSLFCVETGNNTVLWLDHTQVRVSTQSMPQPVVAPPSKAKEARTSKSQARAVKLRVRAPAYPGSCYMAAPIPVLPSTLTVWTYQLAGGKSTPIKTEIPFNTTRWTPVSGVSCVVYFNPHQNTYHVFAENSGAMLGTGKNRRDLMRRVRRELWESSPEDVLHELEKATVVCNTQAVPVPLDVFFNRVFAD